MYGLEGQALGVKLTIPACYIQYIFLLETVIERRRSSRRIVTYGRIILPHGLTRREFMPSLLIKMIETVEGNGSSRLLWHYTGVTVH